jgi:hypothetical protein
MKKAQTAVVISVIIGVIVLAGLIYGVYYFGGFTQSTVGSLSTSDYFQAPLFATIKCETNPAIQTETNLITQSAQSVTYKSMGLSSSNIATLGLNTYGSDTTKIQGQWISDNLPKTTAQWNDIKLKSPSADYTLSRYFIVFICPSKLLDSQCSYQSFKATYGGQSFSIGSTSAKKSVFVSFYRNAPFLFQAPLFESGATFEVTYNPLRLTINDVARVGFGVINPNGCAVPTSDTTWINRIVSSSVDTLQGKSITAETGDNILAPGEYYNYVTSTFTTRNDGNTQDSGYCVLVNGKATVFGIDTITTGESIYRIVNPDRVIGTPDCCNGQSMPGYTCQNGVKIPIVQAQCTSSFQCGSVEFTRDLSTSNQIIKYSCVSGQCKATTQKVTCATDSECLSNQVCSTNSWTCITTGGSGGVGSVQCNASQTLQDGKCVDSLVPLNECSWYQEPYTINTYKSFLGIQYGSPTQTPGCKLASWFILTIVGIIFLIAVIFFGVILMSYLKGRNLQPVRRK